MTNIPKTRYIFWLIRELAVKYWTSLLIGFLLGFILTVLLFRYSHVLTNTWLKRVHRVGIVGKFTPSTLPLFIQNKLSVGLTKLDEKGNVLPGASSWWESTDSADLYKFHLDEEKTWHDGNKLTSDDINYQITNAKFEKENNNTITAVLENSYSPFLMLISKPLFKKGLIGLGDYKVSHVSLKGDRIQRMKIIPVNKNSSESKVYEFKFYQNEAQAMLAYKLGEVDTLTDFSHVYDIKDWGKTNIIKKTKDDRIVTLFYNLNHDLLNEKSIRQALAYAIPKFEYEDAYTPIPKDSWVYFDDLKKYEFDLEKAREILKEAEVNPEDIELTLTTFASYLDIAHDIAAKWAELGVKTTVKVENYVPGDYQVLLSAIDIPPDPDQYLFWHSTQTNTNITGYSNVKIDKLLEDGRQTQDPKARKEIYEDFQERLVDDAPAVFIFYPEIFTITRNDL